MTMLELELDSLCSANLTREEQDTVLRLARDILGLRLKRGKALSNPHATRRYLEMHVGGYRNEVFGCIFLDNRHRIIETEELFNGTIDGASVHPRVVVERALNHNAAALVMFHNHPSGVAEPSVADRHITNRLKDALALVDVRIIDHFVVSGNESVSMAERGWI